MDGARSSSSSSSSSSSAAAAAAAAAMPWGRRSFISKTMEGRFVSGIVRRTVTRAQKL